MIWKYNRAAVLPPPPLIPLLLLVLLLVFAAAGSDAAPNTRNKLNGQAPVILVSEDGRMEDVESDGEGEDQPFIIVADDLPLEDDIAVNRMFQREDLADYDSDNEQPLVLFMGDGKGVLRKNEDLQGTPKLQDSRMLKRETIIKSGKEKPVIYVFEDKDVPYFEQNGLLNRRAQLSYRQDENHPFLINVPDYEEYAANNNNNNNKKKEKKEITHPAKRQTPPPYVRGQPFLIQVADDGDSADTLYYRSERDLKLLDSQVAQDGYQQNSDLVHQMESQRFQQAADFAREQDELRRQDAEVQHQLAEQNRRDALQMQYDAKQAYIDGQRAASDGRRASIQDQREDQELHRQMNLDLKRTGYY